MLDFVISLGVAVGDGYAEDGFGFFGRLDFKSLLDFGGVVVAPEPGHFGGKFGGAVGGVVSSLPIAEMEIVLLGFQCVGHAEIRQRPISVAQVEIFGAVLQPDTEVAFRFAQNFVGKILAAIGNAGIFFPLNR